MTDTGEEARRGRQSPVDPRCRAHRRGVAADRFARAQPCAEHQGVDRGARPPGHRGGRLAAEQRGPRAGDQPVASRSACWSRRDRSTGRSARRPPSTTPPAQRGYTISSATLDRGDDENIAAALDAFVVAGRRRGRRHRAAAARARGAQTRRHRGAVREPAVARRSERARRGLRPAGGRARRDPAPDRPRAQPHPAHRRPAGLERGRGADARLPGRDVGQRHADRGPGARRLDRRSGVRTRA